jgi:hypothetical protein
MKRRIGQIVIVLLLIGLVYYAYVRWQRMKQEANGEVQLLQDGTEIPTRTDTDTTHTTTTTSTDTKPATTSSTVTTQTTAPAPAPAPVVVTTQHGMPTTDSIPANPPNGMVFAGTGRYQLYRQGSLTWRLDTETGHTCIIFATDEEWRKERIYSHGCGNN